MRIHRDTYVRELTSRRHNHMVKVVTGMRRCGKSYLLRELYTDCLKADGVRPDHITYINVDGFQNRPLRDPQTLYNTVVERLYPGEMNYIILDEVQLVPHFEDILNDLNDRPNTDVYVTGSNARFLSRDIITEFRGRGDQVPMHPLSFREFMAAYGGDPMAGLHEYMLHGGLPQVLERPDTRLKEEFLRNLFEETYLRDIQERYDIRNHEDMMELIRVLASGVGSLTNTTNIANTFASVKGDKMSRATISAYIQHLTDAFLVERASRYDIKGRQHIGTPYKYYFTDTGLRNALVGFARPEPGHLLENVLYNELRRRGWQVDVGVVPTRSRDPQGRQTRGSHEVDFVCNGPGGERCYIQSAYRMDTWEKVQQEMRSLQGIGDAYSKIILTTDYLSSAQPPRRSQGGIITMGVLHFLLSDDAIQ